MTKSIGLWVLLAGSVVSVACGGDDSPAHPGGDAGGMCTAPLSLDCQPAFPPTYPMLFQNLFLKTCGSPSTGGSCHGPMGAKGGLVLSDIDGAYDALLGTKGGPIRVVPNDPECSLLEVRLESSDQAVRMPLGQAPLSEGLRCAVRQWIANGATRE
jgi:hypothetical protein